MLEYRINDEEQIMWAIDEFKENHKYGHIWVEWLYRYVIGVQNTLMH